MTVTSTDAERRTESGSAVFFSPSRRLDRDGLTGVRALAALLVLGFHLNALVGPRRMYLDLGFTRFEVTHILTIGWVGVSVFFVLSGFLLTVHFLERMRDRQRREVLVPYLRARVQRVVPAYWARILVALAIAWITTGRMPDWAPYIPVHFVFLQNLEYAWHFRIDGIFWSLPVEFTFYLLLPFAMSWIVAAGKTPVTRAFAVAALSLAVAVSWRMFAAKMTEGMGQPALFFLALIQWPGLVDQFMFGMAAAALFVHLGAPDGERDARWSRRGDLVALGGAVALVAAMYLVHRRVDDFWQAGALFYFWHSVAAAAVATLIFGVAIHGRLARAVFANRAIVFVGMVSYSLYLWHMEIARQLAERFDAPGLGLAAFSAIAVPAILAAAALSYYLVERPFLRAMARSRATAGG